MKITNYEKMIDLIADDGKKLVKVEDGNVMETQRVSLPIGAELWTEVDADYVIPNEYEAAFAEIESALNG